MKITAGGLSPVQTTCDTCALASECLFDQPRMGGFKGPGNRVRNVGYVVVTDRAEGHAAKEDFMSCMAFVECLQGRMLFGQTRRIKGQDGEIIGIIAQEGGTVRQRHTVGINSRGEVIKPMPYLVEPLKKAKRPDGTPIKVNLDDRGQAVDWMEVVVEITIPPIALSPSGGTSYSNEVIARALATEKRLSEAEADAIAGATKLAAAVATK